MRDAIRRLLALAASEHFAAITAGPAFHPSAAVPTVDSSDDELDTWMLRTAGDAQHICGTARMGTGDDAVVDASVACAASTGCASSTHPCSRGCRGPTPTSPSSPSPSAPPT